MLLPEVQVVKLHLNGRLDITGAEQQFAPLPCDGEESDVRESGNDEGPGEREVPVESAREPAPKSDRLGKDIAVEWIGYRKPVRRRAEVAEGHVDLQAARDHPRKDDRIEPVRETHEAVVSPHARVW